MIRQLLEWLRGNGYEVTFLLQGGRLDVETKKLHESLVDSFEHIQQSRKSQLPIVEKKRRFLEACSPTGPTMAERKRNRFPWHETREFVVRFCRVEGVRAVIVQYHFMARVFSKVPGTVLKIIQTHDACSRIVEKIGKKGFDTQDREVSRRLERSRLEMADVIVGIEPGEVDYFRSLGVKRDIIRVGFATKQEIQLKSVRKVKGLVLFYGGNNPLNAVGVNWFISSCWGKVISRHPHAKLWVAGDVCESVKTEGFKNIELLGRVDDLSIVISRAEVIVNPVWLGTGLKIKSIEAVGMGKALVTTPEGAVGLDLEGEPLPVKVVKGENEFCAAVYDLLDRPWKVEELEERALLHAERYLSFESVYSPLRKSLEMHE